MFPGVVEGENVAVARKGRGAAVGPEEQSRANWHRVPLSSSDRLRSRVQFPDMRSALRVDVILQLELPRTGRKVCPDDLGMGL